MKTVNFSIAVFLIILLVSQVLQPRTVIATESLPVEAGGGQLLVRYQDGTPEILKSNARAQVGGELVTRYTLVPELELLSLTTSSQNTLQAAEALNRLVYVDFAESDIIVQASLLPDDPYFGSQWGLSAVRAPQAWDITTGNSNEVVAVLDSGMDLSHPDLAANLWQNPGEIPNDGLDNDVNGYIDDIHGWDFAYRDNDPSDGLGHGTHTAGTIGALGNNGLGVSGISWNVRLMPLKFLNDNGNGKVSDAVLALQYAIDQGVRVSNNSWGGYGFSQAMLAAIRNSQAVGHIFVAAAGNDGTDNDLRPFYPASYDPDNVISVAAITSSQILLSYSNFGATSVDLGAPGKDILSTIPGGYGNNSGTSMAAPHVAGVTALLVGLHPDWTYSQVREAILTTTHPLAALNGRSVTGGLLDTGAALQAVTPPTPTPTSLPTATPAPTATPIPTATPMPSGFAHLGALQGVGSTLSGSKWKATVTITAHNSLHQPLANATVTGTWSNGATGTSSCLTGATGQCSLVKTNLSRKLVGIVFTITQISRAGMAYDPSSNDVNPPSVTIYRP